MVFQAQVIRFWEMPIPQLNTDRVYWRGAWRLPASKFFAFNIWPWADQVFKVARRLNFRKCGSFD
jgi:hypothetical protein